ncbi:unnamed protein product [Musa acuminata subsp. malaccensis]|uniref:Uncharacterized protein n=1 Tax=Musa acuminata subsp. malaccensis TaxID=214687 RepID=A0A804U5L7_MUSAM|nr:unnamed protein product [Musa acuminata subsp. malaccensis]
MPNLFLSCSIDSFDSFREFSTTSRLPFLPHVSICTFQTKPWTY